MLDDVEANVLRQIAAEKAEKVEKSNAKTGKKKASGSSKPSKRSLRSRPAGDDMSDEDEAESSDAGESEDEEQWARGDDEDEEMEGGKSSSHGGSVEGPPEAKKPARKNPGRQRKQAPLEQQEEPVVPTPEPEKPAKRRPGRPRKHVSSEQQEDPVVPTPEPTEPAKRRPGRPRKQAPSEQEPEEVQVKGTAEPADQPEKRGRGRPKKSSSGTVVDLDDFPEMPKSGKGSPSSGPSGLSGMQPGIGSEDLGIDDGIMFPGDELFDYDKYMSSDSRPKRKSQSGSSPQSRKRRAVSSGSSQSHLAEKKGKNEEVRPVEKPGVDDDTQLRDEFPKAVGQKVGIKGSTSFRRSVPFRRVVQSYTVAPITRPAPRGMSMKESLDFVFKDC